MYIGMWGVAAIMAAIVAWLLYRYLAPASWKVEKDPSDGGASVHQGGATLCID